MPITSSFRWAFLALAACCSLILLAAPAPGADHAPFVRGRVLVKFRAEISEAAAATIVTGIGAREERAIGPAKVRVLALRPGDDEVGRAAELSRRPDVAFAELDRYITVDGTVNDYWYASQWHLAKIAAPTAWDTTVGSSAVIIAIIDTGTDGTHPDLVGNMVPGWNFWDNNSDASDVWGHGTATAGTAAAMGNNTIGVASVAYGCKIMPMRITDTAGVGYWSLAASALHWAADHGARVANLSFGGISESATVSDAALYFQQHGGVVAISAGNDGLTKTSTDNPYELVVSATDASDTLTSWSSRGSNIDVSAPGDGIITTSRGGGYSSCWGTSFSAPITAGVAALVISANPTLTGAQARAIVKGSADDLGAAGWDPLYGTGRVNAARAVSQAISSVGIPAITQQPSARTVIAGQSATFSITATGGTLTYQWQRAAAGGGFAAITGATAASYTTPPTTAADNGSSFRCLVANNAGAATSNAALLTVTAAAPTITQQPADQAVAVGQAATFKAAAAGSGLSYQWQRAAPGSSTYAIIAGATAASYTTPGASLTDSGARFRLVATTSGGSATSASAILTVISGDTTPPVISAVAVVDITSRTATVTWTTDEPADSQVQYGATTAYGSASMLDPTLVTAHRVTLKGLARKKTYYFRVLSRDASGNLAVGSNASLSALFISGGASDTSGSAAASGDLSFTTTDDDAGGAASCGLGSGIALLALASLLTAWRGRPTKEDVR